MTGKAGSTGGFNRSENRGRAYLFMVAAAGGTEERPGRRSSEDAAAMMIAAIWFPSPSGCPAAAAIC